MTTALVVVDMQNAFCHPEGSVARSGLDAAPLAAVVPACARLVAAARAAAVPLVFTRYSLAPDWSDAGLLGEVSPALRDARGLIAGSWDAALVSGLEPQAGDLVLDKTRYSAFWGTDLQTWTRAHRVARVVLCGVTTNVCVEGTARDAFAADLRVVVCEDATAAVTPALHAGALESIRYGIGTVMTASQVIAELGEEAAL